MMFAISVAQAAPLLDGAQVVSVIGAILALVGTWVTARITGRSKEKEARVARDKAVAEERAALERIAADERMAEAEQRRLERQEFVEQLREERDAANERTDKLNVVIDKMWSDKAASREYVAALRAQVWAGGTPPPVTAPVGYIE